MNRVRKLAVSLDLSSCHWLQLSAHGHTLLQGLLGNTLAGTQVREEMMVFGECLASSDNHIKISIV